MNKKKLFTINKKIYQYEDYEIKYKNENIYYNITKLLILIIFILNKIIFNKMNVNIYIKFNHLFNDVKKLNYFLRICNDGILINKKKFKKIKNPKISVISTCYNSEKYILRLIRSIQNQCFEDIEIILVDDYSNDNTVKFN